MWLLEMDFREKLDVINCFSLLCLYKTILTEYVLHRLACSTLHIFAFPRFSWILQSRVVSAQRCFTVNDPIYGLVVSLICVWNRR